MRSNRLLALIAMLAALGFSACGDRENEEIGNSGDREGQSPGVTEGTNPAMQTDATEQQPSETDQGDNP